MIVWWLNKKEKSFSLLWNWASTHSLTVPLGVRDKRVEMGRTQKGNEDFPVPICKAYYFLFIQRLPLLKRVGTSFELVLQETTSLKGRISPLNTIKQYFKSQSHPSSGAFRLCIRAQGLLLLKLRESTTSPVIPLIYSQSFSLFRITQFSCNMQKAIWDKTSFLAFSNLFSCLFIC